MRFPVTHYLGSSSRARLTVASVVALAVVFGLSFGQGAVFAQASEGTIHVSLKEFSVSADPQGIGVAGPSRDVTFNVSNDGTMPHQFVVIKTDGSVDQLPLTADGQQVDESAANIIGRIAPIEPGTTSTLTLALTPGTYALICNLSGHYTSGMVAEFDVIETAGGGTAPGGTVTPISLPSTGSGGLAASNHAARGIVSTAAVAAGLFGVLGVTVVRWSRRAR